MVATQQNVWIDLENTPHIPFFAPIIRELESRGYRAVVTARDAYQTCEMADYYRLPHTRIGRHYGSNVVLKAYGLAVRAVQLIRFARRHRPVLAVSHGSRSQVMASNLLRIPSVMLDDYEHSHGIGVFAPTWVLVPEALAGTGASAAARQETFTYGGIKEDVYVPEFVCNPRLRTDLGLTATDLVVTVRPPASEAHYHNPESDVLFEHAMERFRRLDEVRIVLLPRNQRQTADLRRRFPSWFGDGRVIVPPGVVDGLSLLWHSDLVVSGGGTMNREAAALGVPVYSIFRGTVGAVDRQLEAQGRLVLIASRADVDEKIAVRRRVRPADARPAPRAALREIVDHLERLLQRSSCS